MGRGRPRGRFSSRTTFLLLLLLRDSDGDTATLGYFLDMPAKDVYNYLKYLKKQGLVARDGFLWRLTNDGLAYLSKIENIIKKYSAIADEFLTKEIGKKSVKNRQKIGKKIVLNQELEPVIKYFSINNSDRLLRIISNIENRVGKELSETEYSIIAFLVEKTGKLQRKYLWPPEPDLPIDVWLAEETGYDTMSIQKAIRELEAAGIIYLTKDSRRGVIKIRLDRSLER